MEKEKEEEEAVLVCLRSEEDGKEQALKGEKTSIKIRCIRERSKKYFRTTLIERRVKKIKVVHGREEA